MASFDDYLDALKTPLEKFVRDNFADFKDTAKKDINDFLKQAKEDLSRWTALLAEKRINADEFKSLVLGEHSLGRLHALKQAGLAQARWDLFLSGVIAILVDTAITVFFV